MNTFNTGEFVQFTDGIKAIVVQGTQPEGGGFIKAIRLDDPTRQVGVFYAQNATSLPADDPSALNYKPLQPLPEKKKKKKKRKTHAPLTSDGEYKMPDHQRAYVADLINVAYGRDAVTTKFEARTLAGERLSEQQDKASAFLADNPGFFHAPGDGSLVDDLVSRKGVISIQLAWEIWRWSSDDVDAMSEVIARQQARASEREKQFAAPPSVEKVPPVN